MHAYKISLPFASGPSLQYHAERAGCHVDWVALLEIEIVELCWMARECWEFLVSVGSGVQTGAITPNNVGTCSALCHDIDKLKELERQYCDRRE